MSSSAIASPAPVLGDFALTFLALADEPLLDPLTSEVVLESNSLTASRTLDFLSCEDVGRTGPEMIKTREMRTI